MAAELKSPSPRMGVRDHARVHDPAVAVRVLARAHEADHARAIRALAPVPGADLDKCDDEEVSEDTKYHTHPKTRLYSMWINRSNLQFYDRLV